MTRRGLLVGAGAVVGVVAAGPWALAESRGLAYVAAGEDVVHSFAGADGEWKLAGTTRSVAASGVAVGPGGRYVYVGNAVNRFEGLPAGSVETFAADGRGGLRRVGRRGLALFATAPERLAVSPNGRWLAVGLEGGGYNLLAVGEDGLARGVVASLRQIGGHGSGGGLLFLGNGLLIGWEGKRVTALSVAGDGALVVLDRVPGGYGSGRGEGVDAGLLRAIEMAGIRSRGGVGVSEIFG